MKRRAAVSLSLLLAVGAPLAWAVGPSTVAPPPSPPTAPLPPELALLEGAPDATESVVVLRRGDGARVLGAVPHAAGGARKGAVLRGGSAPRVAVVAQQRLATNASTYDSALFLVDAAGVRRVMDAVTNASRPLVTPAGRVLVQRGEDGEARELVGRQLRERRDRLRIDALEADGAVRTLWSGEGQIAFLACALEGEEVALLHLDDARAELLALDAARGTTRTLLADLHLARDFSYDAASGELVFAQAEDPVTWAVRARSLRDGALRTRWRGASDHLMPVALSDGRIALSLPGDHGLALLPRGATPALSPLRVAPLGEGSDAVLAAAGAWIALRHSDIGDERALLLHLPSRSHLALPGHGLVREVLGFTEAP